MGNPFEDLRQAVVVRPMNSPGPQGVAGPELKIQYSFDGSSWHDNPVETDRYLRFSTDNGVSWSDAIYFNNLAEAIEWVEKARQWAENPENEEVEPEQYSALHHALQAKKSEITAGEYAVDAAESAAEAFGAAAPAWDSETVYNYNDVISFDNGHTYRCIGTDIVGVDHAPNIDGVDNEAEWTRITVALDGYFEVDENGDFMPMVVPITSEIFVLDENGDITYQEYIDLELSELYKDLEVVNTLYDFRTTSFGPTSPRYVWLNGLTGPGTPGCGLYWRDELSTEEDDGYNVIVDNDGVRWKRFDFGGSGSGDTVIGFVNSIADLRNSSFLTTTKTVYVAGYYGAGTPGGGIFYRDSESSESDNGGTIIVDNDGIRWKRANVHEEYYASWFGVSTNISNNSPLIQNALDAIPLSSILIFGPGTYNCEQTITIPDHPSNSTLVKSITLQGSAKMPSNASGQRMTTLKYTGTNPSVLTPLIDFRGSNKHRRFIGSIRNILFHGIGEEYNVIGLWFYDCVGSLFESLHMFHFKYGMQIDYYYYYCKFNDVLCTYCDCGVKANGSGNSAVFNYCNFRYSDVGFDFNGGSGIKFNDCYFEGNKTAIKATLVSSLYVNQCYFERNSEYIFNISSSGSRSSFMLVMEKSSISLNASELTSNVAMIRQAINSDYNMSCVLRDNTFTNATSKVFDYLIYVASGDIIIKAENNILESPLGAFPICSKVPLETSYFNNGFTY